MNSQCTNIKCPSCGKVTQEDLNKYDIRTNGWIAWDAIFLVLRSIPKYPLRTLVVLLGLPGALVFGLGALRFFLVPAPLSAGAPTSARMGAAAMSYIRTPLVGAVIQASDATGQPFTTTQVQQIGGAPGAVPVNYGNVSPYGNPQVSQVVSNRP